MLLKILEKNIEIDWDTRSPNKTFRALENIFRRFLKFDLA